MMQEKKRVRRNRPSDIDSFRSATLRVVYDTQNCSFFGPYHDRRTSGQLPVISGLQLRPIELEVVSIDSARRVTPKTTLRCVVALLVRFRHIRPGSDNSADRPDIDFVIDFDDRTGSNRSDDARNRLSSSSYP